MLSTEIVLKGWKHMHRAIKPASTRLHFIDFTRGIVMILMAWDHVSMFWMKIHGGAEGLFPHRNPELSPILFFSRFITHWCAPTFVLLSGISLARSTNSRQKQGYSQSEITLHIIKRGLLLLIFEAFIVSPAFELPRLYFGVIATIGVGLIIFSVARRLPNHVILASSLLILLNYEFLELFFLPTKTAWGHYLNRILIEPGFTWSPYFSLYPVIPWLGVMGLGYTFGYYLITSNESKIKLKSSLMACGVFSIIVFFVVRLFNGYGNLIRRWSNNLLDWLYISKYPPSIAFLLWALGGTCAFMSVGIYLTKKEWVNKHIFKIIHTFGQVPLFFYLTHLWLYRLRLPKVEPPFYLDLLQTVGLWVLGLAILYLFSERYLLLKKAYPRYLQYI